VFEDGNWGDSQSVWDGWESYGLSELFLYLGFLKALKSRVIFFSSDSKYSKSDNFFLKFVSYVGAFRYGYAGLTRYGRSLKILKVGRRRAILQCSFVWETIYRLFIR